MEDLPELLRSARLLSGQWSCGVLSLQFHCLRREKGGSPLHDAVELCCEGVKALLVAHDCVWPHERPSCFKLADDRDLGSLSPWPWGEIETDVSLNSRTVEEDLKLAPAVKQCFGEIEAGLPCPCRLALHIERTSFLWIACEQISAFSNGEPLPMDRWKNQRARWWQGWAEYWAAEGGAGAGSDQEEAFIPAGETELDRSYVPTKEPAVSFGTHDVPPELLAPVRTWFESAFSKDWEAHASAERSLDIDLEDQVKLVRERLEGDEFGSWKYAREIAGWWVEGHRGYVGVLGVIHHMPMEGEPAENMLAQWSLSLRLREGVWTIRTWTEGWNEKLDNCRWASAWMASKPCE